MAEVERERPDLLQLEVLGSRGRTVGLTTVSPPVTSSDQCELLPSICSFCSSLYLYQHFEVHIHPHITRK